MQQRYFYCYSVRLKRALLDNGFHYLCTGINCRSNTKFWLFEATDELNDYKDHVYQTQRDQY